MKKQEIIKAILKNTKRQDGQKFKKEEVQDIINYAIDLTKQALRNGDRVVFRGFGSFVVRHRNSKRILNNKTKEWVNTKEKDHVAFVQSGEFDVNSIL